MSVRVKTSEEADELKEKMLSLGNTETSVWFVIQRHLTAARRQHRTDPFFSQSEAFNRSIVCIWREMAIKKVEIKVIFAPFQKWLLGFEEQPLLQQELSALPQPLYTLCMFFCKIWSRMKILIFWNHFRTGMSFQVWSLGRLNHVAIAVPDLQVGLKLIQSAKSIFSGSNCYVQRHAWSRRQRGASVCFPCFSVALFHWRNTNSAAYKRWGKFSLI